MPFLTPTNIISHTAEQIKVDIGSALEMDKEETNAGKLEIKQADVWTDVAADTDFQESDQELYLVYEGTGKLDVLELQLF